MSLGKGEQIERWRKVPAAQFYEVSDLGRVRSWHRGTAPIVLRGYLSKNGYQYVELRKLSGQKIRRAIHVLVCQAFHGSKPFDKAEVRHLDGTRHNNAAINLCWGTASENRYDSVRHGTHRMVRRAS